jgi:ATP-dependent DNA ligase
MNALKIMPIEQIDIKRLCIPPGTSRMLQPKLNGVHANWDPESGRLYTRNGRHVSCMPGAVKEIKASLFHRYPLEGEIYYHGMPFQKINGLARKGVPCSQTSVLQFHAFDVPLEGVPNKERFEMISGAKETEHFRIVPTTLLGLSGSDLSQQLKERAIEHYSAFLVQGYEGMIVRDPEAFYAVDKTGPWISKIKPVYDLEARLIGFNPAENGSKNETMFGSLLLELDNGTRFNCSGLTRKDRAALWAKQPIGALVTVEYGAISEAGTPVFPRFKDIRWDTWHPEKESPAEQRQALLNDISHTVIVRVGSGKRAVTRTLKISRAGLA